MQQHGQQDTPDHCQRGKTHERIPGQLQCAQGRAGIVAGRAAKRTRDRREAGPSREPIQRQRQRAGEDFGQPAAGVVRVEDVVDAEALKPSAACSAKT